MIPEKLGFGIVTCVLSSLLTWALLTFLRQRVLDVPNERSSHTVPTPRGGGLAIFGAVAVINLATAEPVANLLYFLPMLVGVIILLVVSAIDDVRGLKPMPRFVAHVAAVGLGVLALQGKVFQGHLPMPVDVLLSGLLWLWFINLFNFMDGIDGLAAGQAVFLGLGIYVFEVHWPQPVLMSAAVLGFLFWNWGPAKLFLGDVGSVPLGYVFGAFLLRLAEDGFWAPALILPAYFLADSTATLIRRLYRGELIWEAHKEHFYQRAVQNGRSHRLVAGVVMAANLLLVVIAVYSVSTPLYMLPLAALVVGLLMWWMGQKPGMILPKKKRAV